MIVVAGLTPAWQQILCFDALRWNEVNRAGEAHWCASGKVLNVGLALAHLQAAALTVAPVGGLPAAPIQREFALLGARAQWIEVSGRTRVCTTLLERATGRTTELVENAAPLQPGELERFETAYLAAVAGASLVVLTGSMPAGTPSDFFLRLLRRTACPAVLDLRGPELLSALACRPRLVKPNREELAQTLGRPLTGDDDLRAAVAELHRQGAEWIAVSNGKHALWLSGAGELFRLEPPPIRLVNPIGSGDCLAAGIAWQLDQGRSPLEAVRIGIGAAALNATQLLPGRLNPEAVLSLAQSVAIIKV